MLAYLTDFVSSPHGKWVTLVAWILAAGVLISQLPGLGGRPKTRRLYSCPRRQRQPGHTSSPRIASPPPALRSSWYFSDRRVWRHPRFRLRQSWQHGSPAPTLRLMWSKYSPRNRPRTAALVSFRRTAPPCTSSWMSPVSRPSSPSSTR